MEPVCEVVIIAVDETCTFDDDTLIELCGGKIWTVYAYEPVRVEKIDETEHCTIFPMITRPAFWALGNRDSRELRKKIKAALAKHCAAIGPQQVPCDVLEDMTKDDSLFRSILLGSTASLCRLSSLSNLEDVLPPILTWARPEPGLPESL